ncbi:hypothetical protein LIER_10528 [Lithospermum erythrorhizon]|uniref:Uncharacterized protein n=1 Tax=Lithospermum erythrorhizon TaxID=34254 RepID=A0AAV3PKV6_LITER
MVKTRRGLNTSGKETKDKKKGVGPSDDTYMEVEPPIVNQEAQKSKGWKSKTPVSTSMEEEHVFYPTPIRSIPIDTSIDTSQEDTQGRVLLIHNNYLPWVDYTNVRELNNPMPSRVKMEDDAVSGEKSQGEINIEEDSIGEEVSPIIEERVIDSSVAETSKVADMSDPSVNPPVEDTTGKTTEPSAVSNKYAEVAEDVPKTDGVDVSHVDNWSIQLLSYAN